MKHPVMVRTIFVARSYATKGHPSELVTSCHNMVVDHLTSEEAVAFAQAVNDEAERQAVAGNVVNITSGKCSGYGADTRAFVLSV